LAVGLKKPGAEKLSTLAERDAKLPPFLNPDLKPAADAVAELTRLPGEPANSGPGPGTKKPMFVGALFSRSSATCAGKASAKMPKPPRTVNLEASAAGV